LRDQIKCLASAQELINHVIDRPISSLGICGQRGKVGRAHLCRVLINTLSRSGRSKFAAANRAIAKVLGQGMQERALLILAHFTKARRTGNLCFVGAVPMEIKTELAGVSAIADSCRVNVLVEFGDEEMSIAVLVPDQVSDEQKKILALGRAKSLARKFGNLP
jgi:hypothetical protein